jgi:hypothetical protein
MFGDQGSVFNAHSQKTGANIGVTPSSSPASGGENSSPFTGRLGRVVCRDCRSRNPTTSLDKLGTRGSRHEARDTRLRALPTLRAQCRNGMYLPRISRHREKLVENKATRRNRWTQEKGTVLSSR